MLLNGLELLLNGLEPLIRDGFPKKSSCSFGFCTNEGGAGPCPNFLSTFHKLCILGQFGDGKRGGDPCPNLLAHWRSKKVVQVVQIGGRGRGNLDKIQKNSYFFFVKPSLIHFNILTLTIPSQFCQGWCV